LVLFSCGAVRGVEVWLRDWKFMVDGR